MGRGRGSEESCEHALKREEDSKNLHTQSIEEEYMYLFDGSLTRFVLLFYHFFLVIGVKGEGLNNINLGSGETPFFSFFFY